MKMKIKIALNYLLALSNNNSREWYHSNKIQYKKANEEFEELVQNLIFEIGKLDSSK